MEKNKYTSRTYQGLLELKQAAATSTDIAIKSKRGGFHAHWPQSLARQWTQMRLTMSMAVVMLMLMPMRVVVRLNGNRGWSSGSGSGSNEGRVGPSQQLGIGVHGLKQSIC